MGAGLQPFAADERGGGKRRGRDDVGGGDGRREVRRRPYPQAGTVEPRGEAGGGLRRAVPDRDLVDGADRGMGGDESGRERAGADHDQPPGVFAGEVARGERRGGGGPPERQRLAVEDGKRLAALAGEQEIGAHDARLAALGIVGKDRDDLHAGIASRGLVVPGRHEDAASPRRPAAGSRDGGAAAR